MTNQEAITLLKNIKLFTGYEAKPQITSKLLISLHISIDMAIESLEKEDAFSKEKITKLGQELCKQNRPKEDVYNMFEKGVQTMTVALLKMLKEGLK